MSVHGGNIPASFTTAYTAPSGTSLALDFQTDLTQRIFADSLDSHISGATTVDNKAQGCTAVGVEAPSLPTQKIELKTRYITTYSWADSRVADPRATNAQKAIAVGFDALSIPTHKIVISFYREPSGTALAFNFTDAYTPVSGSAVPAEFSRTISFWPISPSGIEAPSVGAPDIDHVAYSTQVVYPSSVPLSYQWGTLSIILNSRFVAPSGLVPTLSFGTTTIEYKTKVVSPSGVSALSVGQASVSHWVQSLGVAGFTGGAVAAPVIYNTALGIFAPSLPEQVFGTTSVENKNKNPIPAGFDASAFGTQWASNFVRRVLPYDNAQSAYGATVISNKTRWLLEKGRDSSILPNPSVTHKHRTFTLVGFDAKLFGTVAVSHEHRVFQLTGFDAAVYGTNRVEHNIRDVSTTGFDAAKYGVTRAEYRNRGVVQNSTASNFGSVSNFAEIGLFSRVLAPEGIAWSGGVPFLRIKLPLYAQGYDAASFGLPSFLPAEQSVAPNGFVSTETGVLVVTQGAVTAQIKSTGFSGVVFGTALVQSLGQWVVCTGSAFDRVGAPRAASGLNPTSFEAQLIGVPEASPSRQRVYPVGGNALLGRPTVAYGVRSIAPNSIQIDEATLHSIRVQMMDYGEVVRTTTSGLQIRHIQNSYHVHTGAQ